jgi:hypothetical protein
VWLPWQDAAIAAVVLVAALLATRTWAGRAADASRATAREVSVVLVLYAIWQCVHGLAVTHTAGAQRHATWVWNVEQRLHLPSELAVQRQALHHRLVVESLNAYYALVHVPALGILLVWLFFRHRDRYPPVRNVLAVLTAACLVIQTIPVAPPRFRPDLGFVDTGLLYRQSVYGTGGSGISNQLAAMPSVLGAAHRRRGDWDQREPVALAGARPPGAHGVGRGGHRQPLVARRHRLGRAAAGRHGRPGPGVGRLAPVGAGPASAPTRGGRC